MMQQFNSAYLQFADRTIKVDGGILWANILKNLSADVLFLLDSCSKPHRKMNFLQGWIVSL